MKTLWLALCVIAIANMIAACGFVGWLKMSDRLDSERLRSVRLMLAKTITQERSEKEMEASAQLAKQQLELEEAKKGRPPLTASEALAARLEASEIDQQKINAMRGSISVLQMPLQAERDAISRERAKLDGEKAAFRAMVDASNARARDEQFKKTVAVIDALKAPDAKNVLLEIMAGIDIGLESGVARKIASEATTSETGSLGGDGAGALQANAGAEAKPAQSTLTNAQGRSLLGLERALDYLNAMQPRTRTKVVTEFAKDDPKLAGELLERLRTYGQAPVGTEKPLRVGSIQ